jgi:hypothetical protein
MDPATALFVLANSREASTEVVKTGCDLLKTLLGRPFEVAGDMLADQLYAWQCWNRLRIAHRANELMRKDSIAAKVLPAGFLVPLLSAAGDVEDSVLQEMWATLLASGASAPEHQHPAFVNILRNISRDEAIILNNLSRDGVNLRDPDNLACYFAASSAKPYGREPNRWFKTFQEAREKYMRPTDELIEKEIDTKLAPFYRAHLATLGLVESKGLPSTYLEGKCIVRTDATKFGRHFVKACCLTTEQQAGFPG